MTSKSAGFSLIETVITLAILAVVAAIGANILSSGFGAYFVGRDLVPLANRGQTTMERLMREIRGGDCATLTNGTYINDFTITYTDDSTYRYLQTPGSRVLTRSVNGATAHTLMDGLVPGSTSSPASDNGSTVFTVDKARCLVRVTFTMEKDIAGTSETVTVPFRSSVHVRNNSS